jgi:hypothetical protein
MNKIVRENYPALKLPKDLRSGLDPSSTVTVTVVQERRPKKVMSLDEIFAARRPPYRTKAAIDAEVRRQRDEWDD